MGTSYKHTIVPGWGVRGWEGIPNFPGHGKYKVVWQGSKAPLHSCCVHLQRGEQKCPGDGDPSPFCPFPPHSHRLGSERVFTAHLHLCPAGGSHPAAGLDPYGSDSSVRGQPCPCAPNPSTTLTAGF